MECTTCRIQDIRKSEFNIRLNNDRKSVNRQNALQPSNHFKLPIATSISMLDLP